MKIETANATNRPVRFSLDDAQKAADEWSFNCAPAALCAVLNLTPNEIRPLMGDFESKCYTNPTLLFDVLKRSGAKHEHTYRSDTFVGDFPLIQIPPIKHGLMRIQWGGSWTKPGVPMRVRYRKTHWVAVRRNSEQVFDVNAMCVGGWMDVLEGESKLVPWIIRECVPDGDGSWWPTHVIEVKEMR